MKAHLDVVFGLAEKHGVGVDIHLHECGTLGLFQIEEIAARTKALGMQGQVVVSHAYGLGDIPADARRSRAKCWRLRRGDHDQRARQPCLPAGGGAAEAGVTVFSGSDNIRDSWWPYGDGDMLNRANMIGYRSGFYKDHELEAAFDVVTHAGAKALRLEGYGIRLAPGPISSTLEAEHVPEAVVAVPKDRTVYKAGMLVASNGAVVGKTR